MILVVIPILAMINQLVYPAQYAALPRIISEEQLTQANSVFKFAEEGTNMTFDALGGILIGLIGATSLYIVNSVTFAVAVFLFAGVRIPPAKGVTEKDTQTDVSGYFSDLSEGIRIVRGSIWTKMILAAAIANFMVGITVATLPAFAASRGGPEVYGFLLAALGAGIALGAAGASRLAWVKFGQLTVIGYGAGFVLWLRAVYSSWVFGTILLFMLAWIPVGVINVLENSMLQTLVSEELVGRVMSVSSSASWAALPVGSLIGGPVSSAFGSDTTMALTAFGFGFVSLYFAMEPHLRRLPAIDNLGCTEYEFHIEE